MRGVPKGLPGGGPWRILDECPAEYHNTSNAAKKIVARGKGRCICPRAQERWRRAQDIRKASRIARGERPPADAERSPGGRPAETGVPTYVRNMRQDVRPPDLSRGTCRTPHGLRVMDLAQEKRWGGEALAAAELMCYLCPVKVACGQWADLAENPPGSWIGMYGGRTHMARRNAARKKKQEATESEGNVAA